MTKIPSAVHLIIEGKVQGVGFRENLAREARRLGLLGWVRNLTNGAVEAHAQGEDTALSELQSWAEKGPPAAQVSQVVATEADVDFSLTQFERRETL